MAIYFFYPLLYPRIGMIDLANASLSKFQTMGQGKYYLKRNFTSYFDSNEKSVTYYGNDEDYKSLWVGKVKLQ